MSEVNSYQESLRGFREANIKMARYILMNPDLIDGGAINQDPAFRSMDAVAEDFARQLISSRDTLELPIIE